MSFTVKVALDECDHYHRARGWLRTSPVAWWADLDQVAHALGATYAVEELRDMAREAVAARDDYGGYLTTMVCHAQDVLAKSATTDVHRELQYLVTQLRSALLADDWPLFSCLYDAMLNLGALTRTVCLRSTPSHQDDEAAQSERRSAPLLPYVEEAMWQ